MESTVEQVWSPQTLPAEDRDTGREPAELRAAEVPLRPLMASG
jgi:hypothetical protein